MTKRKYEFVEDDKLVYCDVTLTRIRALRDIPRHHVRKGELGGYIQTDYNLDLEGDCWVSDNAKVFDCGYVKGDALARELSTISGSGVLQDDAILGGSGRLNGCMRVGGNGRVLTAGMVFSAYPVGTEDGTLTAYLTNEGTVELTRGCFRGSAAQFNAASRLTHADCPKTAQEYQLLIQVAKSRLYKAACRIGFKINED